MHSNNNNYNNRNNNNNKKKKKNIGTIYIYKKWRLVDRSRWGSCRDLAAYRCDGAGNEEEIGR